MITGHLVDPVEKRIFDATLTVRNGRIVEVRPLEKPVTKELPYMLPGFIDSHVHIESSMLLPENFARMAVQHGTVGVVTDPHEIANVLGMAGVDFMIENTTGIPFHFCFGAPSCVPCTGLETAGAVLRAADIDTLLQRDDIGFLAEMMNVPGVLFDDPEVLGKLAAARKHGKPIDGHAPGLTGEGLKKYASLGISTDHECTTLEEARERLATGIDVLIRNGSAAQDFETLSPLLADYDDHLMFCSDDLHPDDLMRGHINLLVRRAIAKGYPLWNVLRAACVTPVRHYQLPCGLLREGDSADFILVDNLTDFNVLTTCIAGNIFNTLVHIPTQGITGRAWPNNFHAQPITKGDLHLAPRSHRARAIVACNGLLVTGEEMVSPAVAHGHVVSDTGRDILRLMVLNRYEAGAAPSLGLVKGFGLKRGALASSIAHDSHNIVAVGTSDEAIVEAVNTLIRMGGGIVVTDGEGTTRSLPLPIAGLISPLPCEEVARRYSRLNDHAHALGCRFDAPFMTLAFMALPVIPKLKITDRGIFDVERFSYTDLFVT